MEFCGWQSEDKDKQGGICHPFWSSKESIHCVFMQPHLHQQKSCWPLWHFTKVNLALTSDQFFFPYITLLGQNLVSWLTKYFTYTSYGLWTRGENPLKLPKMWSHFIQSVTTLEELHIVKWYQPTANTTSSPPNNFPCSLVPPKDSLWSCLAFMGLEPALP